MFENRSRTLDTWYYGPPGTDQSESRCAANKRLPVVVASSVLCCDKMCSFKSSESWICVSIKLRRVSRLSRERFITRVVRVRPSFRVAGNGFVQALQVCRQAGAI